MTLEIVTRSVIRRSKAKIATGGGECVCECVRVRVYAYVMYASALAVELNDTSDVRYDIIETK